MEDQNYINFKNYCEGRHLICNIGVVRYLEMREEFLNRLVWWKEAKSCVDWCYDRGLRVINANRLRNWMRKSLEFARNMNLKQKQRYSDKNNFAAPRPPPKIEPLWQPPA